MIPLLRRLHCLSELSSEKFASALDSRTILFSICFCIHSFVNSIEALDKYHTKEENEKETEKTHFNKYTFVTIGFNKMFVFFFLYQFLRKNAIRKLGKLRAFNKTDAIKTIPLTNAPDVIGLNNSAAIAHNIQYIEHIWQQHPQWLAHEKGL